MALRAEHGSVVRLVRQIGSAGEAQVHETDHPSGLIAKIYHSPADGLRNRKLRHMIRNQPATFGRHIAWPKELLMDDGAPTVAVGFLMERMPGKPIHCLYGPADRAAWFPTAGWDFLLHVAANCAAEFDVLHSRQVLMADINEGNIFVNPKDGCVGLIDCDSYQIPHEGGVFPCNVGVPMYTPPELQNHPFSGLVRTLNHDRFGMAVMIFRLLFMARHPFAGVPTGPIQLELSESIGQCLFSFTAVPWRGMGVKNPEET